MWLLKKKSIVTVENLVGHLNDNFPHMTFTELQNLDTDNAVLKSNYLCLIDLTK